MSTTTIKLRTGSKAPTSSISSKTAGEPFYDTSNHQLYVYDADGGFNNIN